MDNPQFSFVTFDGNGDTLPFSNIGDISFQVYSEKKITSIALTDIDGNMIETSSNYITSSGNIHYIIPIFQNYPDCFRIALVGGNTILGTSNLFSRTDSKYTSQLTYICNEDSYGFTYCPQSMVNRVRLPFYLHTPQFPQSQEIYEKRNGRKVTMSATTGKEWELETDYLTEDMHEKLIIALSHDEVYVDGQLLTKTGDYSIDWSNYIEDMDGKRTAKATCKLSANIVSRNSNCGASCAPVEDYFDVQPRILTFEAA